ncbi:aminoacetone oxidase family FAD-binding enzyme [Marinomonas sp. UCMA 3892]|uniref:TIGR03862 family flavoprotein n=1 Tax=unclassified Marinomonas TaxID=196814 RepID=UPI00146A9C2A|nr:TIGR03862 family flavoprotein [Marinomonas sp. UCMA 3892]NLU96529.1 aminoacetone oxidase family FAD-binding enzyme [Marinomonas sp. UCMA 3892]
MQEAAQTQKTVIVVGAGPAGLMAAEGICALGHQVHVYDAKPSACRKFLLAGVGGMNITHSEAYPEFIQRYYDKAEWLNTSISQFDADALCEWIHNLGIETFVGTSGRVFPKDMKAAPLLRNWLKRLREAGVQFHMRHKMVGLSANKVMFDHVGESVTAQADAIVLAMGGASWPKLGSDGAWLPILAEKGIDVAPLQSANCGFYSEWSEHLKNKFAGTPLKDVAFSFTLKDGQVVTKKGECIVTQDGMEGSLIYAFSKYLRDGINASGQSSLLMDFLPLQSEAQVIKKLRNTKPKESFSKYLKRTLSITGVKAVLLHESFPKEAFQTPESLARCLKAVPVSFYKTKPIEEVISSAGGVCESSVDDKLMLKAMSGVFCAGEMLDWEAPTGGYLLTACFATGHLVAQGVGEYLA